jgi:O-antigen/teichoic acid export membrane protein
MGMFPALQRILLNRAALRTDAAALVRASQLSAALALLIAVILELNLSWLIHVMFGSSFDDAIPLARILVVGAALWGLGLSLSGLLVGLGNPARASFADGVGFVVLGVGLIPLVQWWGSPGAAIAVVAGSAAATILKASLLARGREVRTSSLLMPSVGGLWRTLAASFPRKVGRSRG